MEFSSSDSEHEMTHRGVKIGTRRGNYKTFPYQKKLIIAAAEDINGDWRAVLIANNVPIGTAYGWIKNSEKSPKQRGGSRRIKIKAKHVKKMLEYIEEDPVLTLTDIRNKLDEDYNLLVSTNTIHKHLHC